MQSRYAHRNRFEVDEEDEQSDDSDDKSEGEDREEVEDKVMDELASDFGKIKNLSKPPDPWSSKDPWQKEQREVGFKTVKTNEKMQISDATKKFDEQLAEILKRQTNQSTTAASSQGDMSWVSPTSPDQIHRHDLALHAKACDDVFAHQRSPSNSKTSSSSPSSEPSAATIKFEEALKNLQKIEIIGKLKEKREEIEKTEQNETQSRTATCKRKSEEPHQPSSTFAAEEDGTPGRNRWKRTPTRAADSRQARRAVTPSTPDMFDFDDLPEIEEQKKERKKEENVGKFTISTPGSPKMQEVGIQAQPDKKDEEVQTGDGERDGAEEEFDMTEVEYVDGVMCKHLCMAAPSGEKAKAIENHEKDENGFYKLKKGITSDSGAGDTVGPDEEFPDYPLEESPGSRRGLHYLAAGGEKINNAGQKKVMILTAEKQLRWITVQIAKVKKTLGSVSKSNDHGIDVCYSNKGSYMRDVKTQEKTMASL